MYWRECLLADFLTILSTAPLLLHHLQASPVRLPLLHLQASPARHLPPPPPVSPVPLLRPPGMFFF